MERRNISLLEIKRLGSSIAQSYDSINSLVKPYVQIVMKSFACGYHR